MCCARVATRTFDPSAFSSKSQGPGRSDSKGSHRSLELHSQLTHIHIPSLSFSFILFDKRKSDSFRSILSAISLAHQKSSSDFEITCTEREREREENWALERHARATAIITLRRIMHATRSYMRRLVTKSSRSQPVE